MTRAIGTRVTASAPGGIGNLGPGLDILGCALAGLRDEVTVEWTATPVIVVRDPGHPHLSSAPERHTASLAAAEVLRMARHDDASLPDHGLVIDVRKWLPLSGGQGGSAASAVAAAVATNALLGGQLGEDALLRCCLHAEERVSGRHLDNIAPSLCGGIVLVRSLEPIDLVHLPVPSGLRIVVALPDQQLTTAQSRGVLPTDVTRATAQHQMAQVAAMVAACYSGDLALFGRSIDDRIAEPVRSALLPGFAAAKRAALATGALGVSISGAGPSAFAIVSADAVAESVAAAMIAAYTRSGLACTTRTTVIDIDGAIVTRHDAARKT